MSAIEIRDQAHHDEISARIAAYDLEVNARFRPPGNGGFSYDPKLVKAQPVTNDERSAVETWRFRHSRDAAAFVYMANDQKTVTTWTGQTLGVVTDAGREWQDSMGGRRVPIDVKGINGISYHGTYFKSAGDYCRLKARKRSA